MMLIEVVAQQPAQAQILRGGLGERAHDRAPGHGRATRRSVSRSTFA